MGVFDRLTDTSLYTGAHKHRFDDNGNGRGLAGRDRVAKGHGHIAGGGGNVHDLSQITRTNLNTSGNGYTYPAAKAAAYTPGPTYVPPYYPPSSSTATQPPPGWMGKTLTPAQVTIGGSQYGANAPSSSMSYTARATSAAGRSTLRTSDEGGSMRPPSQGRSTARRSNGGSIFDKLTDPSQYTGAHRHRFDGAGNGRGAVGRTTGNAYVAAADLMKRF